VLAVLPDQNADVVARDLRTTRSVNATIENALAGKLAATKPARAETETQTAAAGGLSMEQRKQAMVDAARRCVQYSTVRYSLDTRRMHGGPSVHTRWDVRCRRYLARRAGAATA
jgi:hypothetical protein